MPETDGNPVRDDDTEALELEALKRAVAEGDQAGACGNVVSHKRVRRWLLDLARGVRTAPPRPK